MHKLTKEIIKTMPAQWYNCSDRLCILSEALQWIRKSSGKGKYAFLTLYTSSKLSTCSLQYWSQIPNSSIQDYKLISAICSILTPKIWLQNKSIKPLPHKKIHYHFYWSTSSRKGCVCGCVSLMSVWNPSKIRVKIFQI